MTDEAKGTGKAARGRGRRQGAAKAFPTRYLVTQPGNGRTGGLPRYYWFPTPKLKALGFESRRVPADWANRPDAGDLIRAAIAEADALNADMDRRLTLRSVIATGGEDDAPGSHEEALAMLTAARSETATLREALADRKRQADEAAETMTALRRANESLQQERRKTAAALLAQADGLMRLRDSLANETTEEPDEA